MPIRRVAMEVVREKLVLNLISTGLEHAVAEQAADRIIKWMEHDGWYVCWTETEGGDILKLFGR